MLLRFGKTSPASDPRWPSVRAAAAGLPAAVKVLVFCFFGVFFGLASAVLPWQFVVAILGLPIVIFLAFSMPLAAFLLSLLLMFGLVPEFILASIPLAGARLRPPELLLMLVLVAISLRAWAIHDWRFLQPLRALWLPLSLLVAGLAGGFVYGKVILRNELALADARQFIGWCSLPVALWMSVHRQKWFERVILLLSLASATVMLLQFTTGVQFIYGFRGAESLSREYSDVVRSAIGGGLFLLAYSAYLLYLRSCSDARHRWWYLLGTLVLVGGLVVSMNRAVWAGFALGGLFVILFRPRGSRSQMPSLLGIVLMLSLMAGLTYTIKPRLFEAVLDRALSVAEEGQRGSSLGFRFEENRQATAALSRSPVLGVGMGGEYKRAFRQVEKSGSFDTETSFIHNGYLALWLKLGIAGVAFCLALAVGLTLMYLKTARHDRGPQASESRVRAFAGLACVICFYVSALTSPDFSSLGQLAALGIVITPILLAWASVRSVAVGGVPGGLAARQPV